jgi:hypothetical protein
VNDAGERFLRRVCTSPLCRHRVNDLNIHSGNNGVGGVCEGEGE